jgi:DNA polymerase-3 subunit delta
VGSVHFLRGDDASILREATRKLVDGLVGTEDRSLMVEEVEVTGASVGDRAPQLALLVDAAQTPAFLTPKRVVIGRVETATAEEVTGLASAVADLVDTTDLVLVWEAGRVPKALADALTTAKAEQVDASPGRKPRDWVAEQVRASSLKLDAKAIELVTRQLGEDLARLPGLLATLQSTFGAGVTLSEVDVAPYLGEAGGIAPWDLTDALDKGDIPTAVDKLHRMMGSGSRHALAVLATLHSHYARMLALDGADVRNDRDAAALLGMKGSTFPAKKALEQGRRLGPRRVGQAITWLAQADLDLKGARKLPDDLVMEVLVARLSRLKPASRR